MIVLSLLCLIAGVVGIAVTGAAIYDDGERAAEDRAERPVISRLSLGAALTTAAVFAFFTAGAMFFGLSVAGATVWSCLAFFYLCWCVKADVAAYDQLHMKETP